MGYIVGTGVYSGSKVYVRILEIVSLSNPNQRALKYGPILQSSYSHLRIGNPAALRSKKMNRSPSTNPHIQGIQATTHGPDYKASPIKMLAFFNYTIFARFNKGTKKYLFDERELYEVRRRVPFFCSICSSSNHATSVHHSRFQIITGPTMRCRGRAITNGMKLPCRAFSIHTFRR